MLIFERSHVRWTLSRVLLIGALIGSVPLGAQLNRSALRVLGQPDFTQNGVNTISGEELNGPRGVAIDERGGEDHLYVADTLNNRVLAWRDALSAASGAPADLVLGQPEPHQSGALGIGPRGLTVPVDVAVDAVGNLYVADLGNNRVVRFPAPLAMGAGVEPNAVYGQPDFEMRGPNTGGIGPNSMNAPRGITVDSLGNLWVSDTGNNRVLRYPAGMLDSISPTADLVLGQPTFAEGAPNRGGAVAANGLWAPTGIVAAPDLSVHVADFQNARVVTFAAPYTTGEAAVAVLGQPDLVSTVVPATPSASTLRGPGGLSLLPDGGIATTVAGDHRVVMFAADASGLAAATGILGQADFLSADPNRGTFPRASATGLSSPNDVAVDSRGNRYVADTDNHRVLLFRATSGTASGVWGQPDFTANAANRADAGSLNSAADMVIDYSQRPFALYVADANNHRVLVWEDSARFELGAPADRVIGQPDLQSTHANGETSGGMPSRFTLSSPRGVALDPDGNLFVADSGNNRVLRYRRPLDQGGPIEPEAVFGQANFTNTQSFPFGASTLNTPWGLAVTPSGRLFVADRGNNRVLEFEASAGSASRAVRVFGQPSFLSGVPAATPSVQSLNTPTGVYVDEFSFLYVADTGSNRVVVYPNASDAPEAGASASFVIGQPGFNSGGPGGGATGLAAPGDVSVSGSGRIFVSDNGNHRVVGFPPLLLLPDAGGAATEVVGQSTLGGRVPNFGAAGGQASPQGLLFPAGIFVDRFDNLYVGDTGNNRLVQFLQPAVGVNAATFRGDLPVSGGGLAALFGVAFSSETEAAAVLPLPESLGGREVEFDTGLKSPALKSSLLFVSPGQINLQIPSALPLGSNRILVRTADTGELVAGSRIVVAATSPGFFVRDPDTDEALALNADGSTNSPTNPAAVGSFVTLFGTGQGQVAPPVPDGQGAAGLSSTVAIPTSDGTECLTQQPTVCVAIGSQFGEVLFSGLAPGLVGVWQVNVTIPAGTLPADQVPVRAVINGRPSNLINIAVGN